jgi:hypothetical protein
VVRLQPGRDPRKNPWGESTLKRRQKRSVGFVRAGKLLSFDHALRITATHTPSNFRQFFAAWSGLAEFESDDCRLFV